VFLRPKISSHKKSAEARSTLSYTALLAPMLISYINSPATMVLLKD